MKKFIVACACLVFIMAAPLGAAVLEKKPVNKTDQTQTTGATVETKGLTQAPNRVSTTEKVSSTGHKHDGQGSEDLRPNPLDAETAESVNTGQLLPASKPLQQ